MRKTTAVMNVPFWYCNFDSQIRSNVFILQYITAELIAISESAKVSPTQPADLGGALPFRVVPHVGQHTPSQPLLPSPLLLVSPPGRRFCHIRGVSPHNIIPSSNHHACRELEDVPTMEGTTRLLCDEW